MSSYDLRYTNQARALVQLQRFNESSEEWKQSLWEFTRGIDTTQRTLMLDEGVALLGHSFWRMATNSPGFAHANEQLTTAFSYYWVEPGGSAGYNYGIALLSKHTRWANPAGGSWATASNWLPLAVPASSATPRFELEASYAVTVGQRQAAALTIGNGSVTFRQGRLTLAGTLDIKGDASLRLPDGSLRAGEIKLGSPPNKGAGPPENRPSSLSTNGTVLLGVGANARVLATIMRGGTLEVGGKLKLAEGAASTVVMTVAGFSPSGARASVNAISDCTIGAQGSASLLVRQGGIIDCQGIQLGLLANSEVYVLVDGEEQNTPATLFSRSQLCLGTIPLCLVQDSNARARLELGPEGVVIAEAGVFVGNGSRIGGSGSLTPGTAGLMIAKGGYIDPSIRIEGGQLLHDASAPNTRAAIQLQPGALTVMGDPILKPGATVSLDVLGAEQGQHDQLLLTGKAVLDGTLELRFGNGFAPRRGQNFSLIKTDKGGDGSFQEVLISGLAPGFEYSLDLSGGGITLKALNDGVPTTNPPARLLYLPLVRR